MRRRLGSFSLALALVGLWAFGGIWGDESCHAPSSGGGGGGASYTVTAATYHIPPLTLIDQEGQEVDLTSVLDAAEPVALNFIFTSCVTICPVMTATFSKMQDHLADRADDLRMVSISIDPEFDTPRRLKEYSGKFGAKAGWSFLTGEAEQISTVLQAFNALHGSKMNHRPLTFFRMPGEERWIRIDGLASASDLADEYLRLSAQ